MIFVVGKYLYCIIIGVIMAKTAKPKKVREVNSYTSKAGVEFKVEDKVKLNSKATRLHPKVEQQQTDVKMFAGIKVNTARVEYIFPDIKGLVRLSNKLGGYWTWDVNDLEKVR